MTIIRNFPSRVAAALKKKATQKEKGSE